MSDEVDHAVDALAARILRKIVFDNCASMGQHPPDTVPSEAATWRPGLQLDCAVPLTEAEWVYILATEAEYRIENPEDD